MIKAKVRGLSQLNANYRRVGAAFDGPALDDIMGDSLEPLRNETEQNARALRDEGNPRGGHLDQGVVSRKIRPSTRRRRTWWVSFRKRAKLIAHLVEFGTAPHDQPRRGIRHPGAVPKPFFRRAFESKKYVVIDIFRIRAWKRIYTSIRK